LLNKLITDKIYRNLSMQPFEKLASFRATKGLYTDEFPQLRNKRGKKIRQSDVWCKRRYIAASFWLVDLARHLHRAARDFTSSLSPPFSIIATRAIFITFSPLWIVFAKVSLLALCRPIFRPSGFFGQLFRKQGNVRFEEAHSTHETSFTPRLLPRRITSRI